MGLELSQLDNLRCRGRGAVQVADLPRAVAEYIGCQLGFAYISGESIRHILKKHPDVELVDMVCLPDMVRRGLWVEEPGRTACVLYDHPIRGLRFKAAIKAAGDGFETYIGTFHRVAPRQTRSVLRRGRVLCGYLEDVVGDLDVRSPT